jgi:hypothetical protein
MLNAGPDRNADPGERSPNMVADAPEAATTPFNSITFPMAAQALLN